jgi:hypothetical protein
MFKAGQDVLVQFDGEECRGEVVEVHRGWVLTRILVDPAVDFGTVSARMSPVSLAMVRESEVRTLE